MSHIPAGPDLARDLVLSTLASVAPYAGLAAWAALPVGTLARLLAPEDDAAWLRWAFVAQHQDGGGQPAPLLNSAGWSGLVTVKCLSASRAYALTGRDQIAAVLPGATAPAGYGLTVRYTRPAPPLDDPDGIYHRGLIYEVILRRAQA